MTGKHENESATFDSRPSEIVRSLLKEKNEVSKLALNSEWRTNTFNLVKQTSLCGTADTLTVAAAKEATANAGLFKPRRATYGSLERANQLNKMYKEDLVVSPVQVFSDDGITNQKECVDLSADAEEYQMHLQRLRQISLQPGHGQPVPAVCDISVVLEPSLDMTSDMAGSVGVPSTLGGRRRIRESFSPRVDTTNKSPASSASVDPLKPHATRSAPLVASISCSEQSGDSLRGAWPDTIVINDNEMTVAADLNDHALPGTGEHDKETTSAPYAELRGKPVREANNLRTRRQDALLSSSSSSSSTKTLTSESSSSCCGLSRDYEPPSDALSYYRLQSPRCVDSAELYEQADKVLVREDGESSVEEMRKRIVRENMAHKQQRVQQNNSYFLAMHKKGEIDIKKLIFSDHLETISSNGKSVGDFYINLGYGLFRGEKLFSVSADSHGTVDGVACGTSIKAWVDDELKTVTQTHKEYVKLPNHEMERVTTIERNDDNSYVITKKTKQGEDNQTTTKNYTETDMNGFISEGANIILLRVMVKVGLKNCVRFLTMDSEIEFCQSSYRPLPRRQHVINKNETFDVHGIERVIETEIPTVWMNFFMSDGHLANRVQIGSPVIMNLVEVPADLFQDENIEKPIFSRQEIDIDEDMQLNSMNTLRKEELKSDYTSYLASKPEIKDLISDFVQHLLMKKPDCVISEATEYFRSFDRGQGQGSPLLHSNQTKVQQDTLVKNKIKDLVHMLS